MTHTKFVSNKGQKCQYHIFYIHQPKSRMLIRMKNAMNSSRDLLFFYFLVLDRRQYVNINEWWRWL